MFRFLRELTTATKYSPSKTIFKNRKLGFLKHPIIFFQSTATEKKEAHLG